MAKVTEIKRAIIIPYQKDYSCCNKVIKAYAEESTQALKTKVVEMYKPMIEKKAADAALKLGISEKDYTQDLYLQLLENLDSFAAKEDPARLLTQFLQSKKPNNNTSLPKDEILFNELPEETIICTPKDKEAQLDYDYITKLLQKILNEIEFSIVSERADGTLFKTIAETLELSSQRVEQLYNRALKKIKNSKYRSLLEEQRYNDKRTTLPVIPADKQLFPFIKKEQVRPNIDINSLIKHNVGADRIRELTKNDYNQPNYWGTLDILIRTQSMFPRILYDHKTQESFKSYLGQRPGYKIKIELPHDIERKTFIPQAEKISMNIFGENIFEFI
jgi:DNA-directed RNA polymerase specialized sigma subunit